jgi:hypothetical protein
LNVLKSFLLDGTEEYGNVCIYFGVYNAYTECAAIDIPQTRHQRQREEGSATLDLSRVSTKSKLHTTLYTYIYPSSLDTHSYAPSLDSCYYSIEQCLHQRIHQFNVLRICFHHPDLKGREHWNLRENSRHQYQYRHYIQTVKQAEVVVMGIIILDRMESM